MSYEFRSFSMQSLAYDASTNLPPLVALSNGGQYIVGTQGRIATTTIAGAQDGADAVLLAGDTVQSLDGGYSLVSAAITATQNVDVGVGGTALFASLLDAMTYLAQRTIDADVVITVNLLASYTGVEAGSVTFAHPQASQIQVLGIASSQTISACTGVTGAIGDLAVSYTLAAPITDLAVGDVVIIDQETTTNAQTTAFLGSHCGTWLVSAVAGTAVTVQNIQKMKTTLTNADFGAARMTKVTKIAEQGNFSNVDKMAVGNLAFHHDLNKYVFYGKNGSILVNGFLGAGSTSASVNTKQVTLTEDFDVLSAAYQELNSDPTTYVLGLNSVFAANCGKSTVQNGTSGMGGMVIGGDINVETLVCGTQILYSGVPTSVVCKNKFGGYIQSCGSFVAFIDGACNVNSGANNAGDGQATILTQTACNNNTTGNVVNTGMFTIGIQTACNNNVNGNWAISGVLSIALQTACTGNTTANNVTSIGKIFISGGTSTTTGTVNLPNGGGSVVKSSGTNPFTVTDAPTPVNYAVDTTLTAFNYFSIATANNVDFTLPLVSTVQQDVTYTIKNGGVYTGVTVIANAADTGGIGGVTTAITLPPAGFIQLIATSALTWTVVASSSNILGGSTSSLVGYKAGILSSALTNQLFGYNSGSSITSGGNNTYLGAYTGSSGSDSTRSNNVILSDGAGNVTLRSNGLAANTLPVAIGLGAAALTTTGASTTAVGINALSALTTNGLSTAVGYQAGKLATGAGNQLFGYNAGSALSQSIATLGAITGGTLYTNGTYSNVNMSLVSGTAMTNYPKVYITVAGGAVTECTLATYGMGGDTTTVLTVTATQIGGTGSGFSVPVATVTACANNTIVGASTGVTVAQPSNNVVLSDGAGNVTLRTNGASELSNISMGLNALPNSSANMVNIAIGGGALASATTQSVAIGNIGIGYRTLYNNSTGLSNIAIGNSALALNTGGGNAGGGGNYTGSLAIGTYALSASTTGQNIALGNSALKTCTTGTGNVAFGYSALRASTTANANVAVGFSSGVSTSTGASNTYIGSSTGFANTTGSGNTYVGVNSGYTSNGGSGGAMGPSTGSNNTYVGATSGGASLGAASNNTYIGSSAGLCTSEGSNNNYIGTSAAASMALTATIGGFAGGSGYVDGTYTNVPLQYFNAYFMLLYPVCNITVLGGTVTAVTIVKQGLFSTNSYTVQSIATAPNSYLGGSGSGFTVSLGAISGFGTASSSSFNTFLGGYNGAANVTDASTGNNVILSDGSGNIVFRANGTSGKNTLIGLNSGLNLFSVSAFGWLNGGTGYASGGTATYNNVTMSGSGMTVYPVVNVEVTAGVVTAVTLVSGGSGAGLLQNTFLTVTAAQLGGTGSGFSIAILSTATPTNCTYLGGYTGSADAATNNNVILSDGAGNVTLKANGITQAYNANTAWTPTDGSGAALALTIVNATYSSMSNQVTFTSTITYPTTANGSNAIISSAARAANQQTLVQAFSIGLGIALVGVISAGGTSIALYNATTGVAVTNTTLSGATVIISGTYST